MHNFRARLQVHSVVFDATNPRVKTNSSKTRALSKTKGSLMVSGKIV